MALGLLILDTSINSIICDSIYWNHTMWSLLPSFFFYLAYCFQDTCCYMYQYFIPLCYQVMFHFMDILHLLMQSSVDVHFGYFYFLAIWIILLWKHKFFYEYIFLFLFLRITGSHVNFKIFEELTNYFQYGCNILHFH